jgi:trehalose-6-phosphate synthase
MDTENLSTTRTKIGDAINSAVAMSEAETEQAVDAVLDAMTGPDLDDLCNSMEDRIRWARSTVGLIVSDEQTESAISMPPARPVRTCGKRRSWLSR